MYDAFSAVFVLLVVLLFSPVAFFPLGEGVFLHSIGFSLLTLAAGLLVLATLDWQPRFSLGGPVSGFLALIGVHSYSVYLWHMPVQRFLPRVLRRISSRFGAPVEFGYGTNVCLYLVGSIALGILMSKLIDIPCLAWRDRWFPSRAKSLS